jgi:hypothetical protein
LYVGVSGPQGTDNMNTRLVVIGVKYCLLISIV